MIAQASRRNGFKHAPSFPKSLTPTIQFFRGAGYKEGAAKVSFLAGEGIKWIPYFVLMTGCVCASIIGQVPNQMILRKIPMEDLRLKVGTNFLRTNKVSEAVNSAPTRGEMADPATEVPDPGGMQPTGNAAAKTPNNSAQEKLKSQVIRVRGDHQPLGDTVVARAGLNDELWIDVRGFPEWLTLINSNRVQANQATYEVRDLIPFFNGSPVPGVHANYAKTDREITSLRFKLVRNKDSKEAWSRMWKNPRFEKPAGVSIGFSNGEEIPTLVVEDATEPRNRFTLILIRQPRFWLGAIVLLGALYLFLRFARDTDIIRDTSAPERPDGKWPYSLAKAQMAFWFFLVIASFFFLWVLTGAMDTLNNSVLILIGISATTAIGAAIIDARPGRTAHGQAFGSVPPVDTRKPRAQIVKDLSNLISEQEAELDKVTRARGIIDKADSEALDRNEREIDALQKQISTFETQKGYFSYPAWRGVLNDLLGDQNVIGFHRFQIFVWTLLLGLIFVTQVYNEFAMPEFDATLLGLLGISAGTYVGFKLPESKRETAK